VEGAVKNSLFSSESDTPNRVAAIFMDREAELQTLAQQLLVLQTRVVLISGPAGIGKTALAFMFAQRHKDAFPGGVFDSHTIPGLPLSELALRAVPESEERALLIVNDLHVLPDSDIETELNSVLTARPQTQVILTSRREMQVPLGTVSIRLAPFTRQQMEKFFRIRLGYELDQLTQEQLFELLQGHPLAAAVAVDALQGELFTMPEFLDSLQPFSKPGLLGPDGRPLKPGSESYRHIVTDVTSVSDELLKELAKGPELLYQLSPRLFEEVVAELLARLGYKITLTPASRDGGKDIYAASRNELGSFLYIVECKRYDPDNRVGVGLVRQLYGVVQAEKATAGILATTSFFTKGAKEFQRQVAFQISLQDYLGIQKWLHSVQGWSG
jgi:restriction system protein